MEIVKLHGVTSSVVFDRDTS